MIPRYPALTIGVIGLLLLGIVHLMEIPYDSSGLFSVVYWTSLLFCFPLFLALEMLTSIGLSFPFNGIASIVFHLAFYYFIDKLIYKYNFKKKSNKSN